MAGTDMLDPREALARAYAEKVAIGPNMEKVGAVARSWGPVVAGYARCERCSARCQVDKPIRPTFGSARAGGFAVVMPKHDLAQRVSGSCAPAGRGPKLLEAVLMRAGVDREVVAWGTVAGCPTDSVGPEMVAGCRANVLDWLRGFDCVLLVGAATAMWRPDVTVERLTRSERLTVGLMSDGGGGDAASGPVRQTWVVGAVSSPWSVFGHPDPPSVVGALVHRMIAWRETVEQVQAGRMPVFGRECASCGGKNVTFVDPDGLGWCKTHTETLHWGYGAKSKKVPVKKLGGLDRWSAVRATIAADQKKVDGNAGLMSLPFG